jgi:hypothetical protein
LKETRRRSQWLVLNTYARVLRRLVRYLGVSQIKADTRDEEWNEITNTWWCEEYRDRTGNYDISGKYNADTFLTAATFQAWRDSDCTGIHLWKLLANQQIGLQKMRDAIAKTHSVYPDGRVPIEAFSNYRKPLAERLLQLPDRYSPAGG